MSPRVFRTERGQHPACRRLAVRDEFGLSRVAEWSGT